MRVRVGTVKQTRNNNFIAEMRAVNAEPQEVKRTLLELALTDEPEQEFTVDDAFAFDLFVASKNELVTDSILEFDISESTVSVRYDREKGIHRIVIIPR